MHHTSHRVIALATLLAASLLAGKRHAEPAQGQAPTPAQPSSGSIAPMTRQQVREQLAGNQADEESLELTPHAQMSPESFAALAQQANRRMAEHRRRVSLRVQELQEKAAQARKAGDATRADQLEAAARDLLAAKRPDRAARPLAAGRIPANHRRAYVKSLWLQFGEPMNSEAVLREFSKHAWRIAQLERVLELALAEPSARQQQLSAKATALVEKENVRHRVALNTLLGASPGAHVAPPVQGMTGTVPSTSDPAQGAP